MNTCGDSQESQRPYWCCHRNKNTAQYKTVVKKRKLKLKKTDKAKNREGKT